MTEPARTIAKWYWTGKDRIAMDTNAHDLMVIWNLPESIALQDQTLEKLAIATWRLRTANASAKSETDGAPSAELLRPILNDLLQKESYLEIRQTGEEYPVLAFAIKLDEDRAALWATNLSAAFEGLTGRHPEWAPGSNSMNHWSLTLRDSGRIVELGRAGNWTILGFSAGSGGSNTLATEFAARIAREGLPFTREFAADWINADVDVRQLGRAFGIGRDMPENTPELVLRVNGDGQYVRTRGELNFPEPLDIELEPWNVPTNLITGELHSLVAVRGIRGLLENSSPWSKLNLGPPPNQLFSWGYDGLPAQVYVAAQLPGASNRVEQFSHHVLEKGKDWLATNDLAGFKRAEAFHGLTWKGIPFLYPFVKSVGLDQGDFVVCGSVVVNQPEPPPPAELIGDIFAKTNSVYFDREFTGGQIKQWLYITQFARYVTHQAQLPARSAGQRWLHALMPVIGSSGTDITMTGPSQLSFARTAGSGFTALELHLLADWFESPGFPMGLHTFLAEPDPNVALP